MASSPGLQRESNSSQTVCLACRQRKIRCDRRRPVCGFCTKSGARCQYQPAQQTPGLRAGYVSRLEDRIAVLEQSFEDFKKQISPNGGLISSEDRWSLNNGGAAPPPALASPTERESTDNVLSLALSPQELGLYCTVWFDQYHSWFPILHEPTILESCEQFSAHRAVPVSLVIKAIAAVVAPTQPWPPDVSAAQRCQWLLALEDSIMLTAMHNLSLQSLQALLVLTIPIFGAGRMVEFYNLIALCKRISTQLGLRDLVIHHCANFGVASAIPPRMLFIPLTAVEREEKIRAFWTTEALDSISTLGAAWHLSVSRPELAASVPCDEQIWRYPESVLATYLFGNTDAPSSFSLFVSLATNELWHIHHFLQQSYDQQVAVDLQQRKQDCDAVYERLMSWQSDFERVLAIHSPPYVDLFSTGESTGQHPNSILIHCTIHSAVISLYQRFIFPVGPDPDDVVVSWTGAADRCLESCNSMVSIVRGISDRMLETINPHVIFCVFIAARFYVIFARASSWPVPEKLYLLIYAFSCAGKRWPLAKQLKIVLDAAITEGQPDAAGQHPLPLEFYNLQYLSWDIHEALKKWAEVKDSTSTSSGTDLAV